jgi:hypothetical protein
VAITYAGHTVGFTETQSQRRFIVLCSCGHGKPRWKGDRPATKATEAVAVADCIRHLAAVRREVLEELKRAGLRPSAMPKAQGTSLRIAAPEQSP